MCLCPAGLDHCFDLLLREQLLWELGVPVHPGRPDFQDLRLGHVGVAVVDHPEVELLEKEDVVMQGVLLEGPAFDVRSDLDGGDDLVDFPDGAGAVGPTNRRQLTRYEVISFTRTWPMPCETCSSAMNSLMRFM